MQTGTYSVTRNLQWEHYTRDPVCTLDDILEGKLQCLDMFVLDIVNPHVNTTDRHGGDDNTVFHIPAFFGDDFAYKNAYHNFHYIDALSDLLSASSKDRFNM